MGGKADTRESTRDVQARVIVVLELAILEGISLPTCLLL
jgi:hypothetical protein